MTAQQDELDEELEALTEAALRWEGTLPSLPDDPGTLPEFLAPIVAAIRRQAAADALRRKAKSFDNTARMFRDMSERAARTDDPESSQIYWVHSNQARTDAAALRKEADGIIAEGYEYECQECDTPVPDAGDLCEQHDVDDEDKWSE